MIAVIDYGAGNLRSVKNALDNLGAEHKIVSTADEILAADALILPGVGEFGCAMEQMSKHGIIDALRERAKGGCPLLGICLGMQMFFESSEESPGARGLGILPGRVVRFPYDLKEKVPHMGWNSLKLNHESKLFSGLDDDEYVYFVHSYFVVAENRADVAATAEYGVAFDAAVEHDNIFGCQFHPEKSGAVGQTILKNFIKIADSVK